MNNDTGQAVCRAAFYVLKQIRHRVRPAEWQQEQRNGDGGILLFVTEGTGRLIIDKTGYNLEQGKGYIVAPDATLSLTAGKDGLSYYELAFEWWRAEGTRFKKAELRQSSGLAGQGELSCRPFSQCIDYLESLCSPSGAGVGAAKTDAEAFLSHVRFQELMRFVLEQNWAANGNGSGAGDMRQAVEQSVRQIQLNYRQTWTVDQLAGDARVARWHYTRLFKEITGQVPLDFLNKVRIDRAKQLLLTTGDRLYDIAQHVGFSNEYYFSHRFKTAVGISPGQFRRNHQGGVRVFAPFLEDYLVALGITPVAQYAHGRWGKQEYLGLHDVPVIDIEDEDVAAVSLHKPDFIMLDEGAERWTPLAQLGKLAPTYHLTQLCEDWRSTLRKTAELLGKPDVVNDVIAEYERKAGAAKKALRRSVRGQTVAFLRISALGISLYAGPQHGYTGPVLYKDLGLTPHPLVLQLTNQMRKAVLTTEWLAQLDADHLFITFDKRHSAVEGEERLILESPVWRALPAVRNGCVYEVDFLTWMNYGVISHGKKIDDVLKVL